MPNYNLYAVGERFGVSVEAVRKWCIEFERYLSPRANPGGGKTRILTEEDLTIIALIVERRAESATYAEIHADLENGQRGKIPEEKADSNTTALVAMERMRQVLLDNERLTNQVADYQKRLEDLERQREEVIRVQATLDMERLRAERAETTIQQLLEERRELDREIARLHILLDKKD